MRLSKQSCSRYSSLSIVLTAALCAQTQLASAQAMPAASDPMAMAGCCASKMGKMPKPVTAMPAASPKAQTMPGFPGHPHLYHVGATGFFLDHSDTLALNTSQTAALNQVKERTMRDQSSAQRKIDQAEQELWQLTASDQPSLKDIETKVREIEKLSGDQRIAFIRGVGEAASVLTSDQRAAALGKPASGNQPGMPTPAAGEPMKGMSKPMAKDKPMPMKHDMPMPMDHDMPMPSTPAPPPAPPPADKPMSDM